MRAIDYEKFYQLTKQLQEAQMKISIDTDDILVLIEYLLPLCETTVPTSITAAANARLDKETDLKNMVTLKRIIETAKEIEE